MKSKMEWKMSYAEYRNGIVNLAQDEAAGEDISNGISRLAAAAKIDADTVRHEVTEALELVE